MTGTVNARGKGYFSLVPIQGDDGMSFHVGGPQNTDTAFLRFTGTSVGAVFQTKGEIRFTLKSAYSFAERQALPSRNYRYVFDAFDATRRKFFFATSTSSGRLMLTYGVDGSEASYFYIPVGNEDVLFGLDVTLNVRITWDGKTTTMYLNDVQVYTALYTPYVSNWTSVSSIVLGAQNDTSQYPGGYYALDDVLADFEVR